jgi:hypothetical protein
LGVGFLNWVGLYYLGILVIKQTNSNKFAGENSFKPNEFEFI